MQGLGQNWKQSNLGFSRNSKWKVWTREGPRREREVCLKRFERRWVEYTVICPDKAILSASRVSSAAAARALRHGCHPETVTSSCLDKKATARFEGPGCGLSTPVATPDLSSV